MRINLPIIFLILLISHSTCYGQFPSDWGVLMGMSSSNLEYNYTQSDFQSTRDHKNGLKIGIFKDFIFNRYFNLQLDMSFVQRGAQDKEISVVRIADTDSGFEVFGYFDLRFDYISLELLPKVKYPFQVITPYISIGPTLSYLLGGNDLVETSMDIYNKFIVGISAGMGTEVNVSLPIIFLIELRYYRDITNLYNNDYLTIKNHSFEFIFGLKF